jgi:prolyl-tRNA synthetase
VSPLSISKENASAVQVVLDSQLIESQDLLAFHPSDESKTVFITSAQLREYLASTGVKTTEVEFTAAPVGGYDIQYFGLTDDSAVGKAEAKRATPKPAKEDAKIEGAALIGIDVRKELDFPTWYQQVLTKGDMVRPKYAVLTVA